MTPADVLRQMAEDADDEAFRYETNPMPYWPKRAPIRAAAWRRAAALWRAMADEPEYRDGPNDTPKGGTA